MMTIEHSPLQFVLTWGVPLIFIGGHFIMLVACIVGATHPTLRREFIWLGLGTLFRCFGIAVPLVTNLIQQTSKSIDSSSLMKLIQTTGFITAATGMLSMLFYLVGIGLLALRVRSLPLVRRS